MEARQRRRANGEGSIYKRKDGRWVASISTGKGTRKHYFGQTRQEASEKLTTGLKQQQDGLPLIVERQSVGQFLEAWLGTVRSSLKPRTWSRYEQLCRIHVVPGLGRVPLAKLGPQHLQSLYAEMQTKGRAPASVRQLHAVVHRALRQATRWNLVGRNVADLVTPPRIVPNNHMNVLSPEQARCLLDEAKGDQLEGLYVLALTTGMRQGEILALHWQDVDLERRTLNVRFTVHRTTEGFSFTDPKTSRSRRQIVLSEVAIAALRRHRIRQTEDRMLVGPAWRNQDLVFTDAEGGPLDGTVLLRYRFRPLLARAGLPTIRFHDLRHTAATLLLGQGIHAKIVSEMLGHSNIAITLDLYSHVTPTMQRDAARAFDVLLGA